ncbi:type IV toxin-antitoxin system AbiEi family antitoxin domain-containing protein [Candidatus Amarolinea aalborgensis]|uniref:type IV toxin-antitoxin system AbiEi family antitoxin domain-containing protein n=1 Tax=Candidatus Amarolinea aalborgensis TaxID=2249329 RepID=UPI003BF9CF36
MPDQIQLSHLEQTAYFAALRKGLHVVDVKRLSDVMAVSPSHAPKLLASMARKGALQRVGRGRYVVVSADVLFGRQTFVADPFQVVDELLQREGLSEYYVAYQSAAFIYGAADQLPQALLVALPRQRRPITLGRAKIIFVQVQRTKFFGIQETRYHDSFFRISDREKTLLDCLDRFDLCGGIDDVAHTISVLLPEADPERLLSYLPDMTNQALVHRLGYILEKLSTHLLVPQRLLDGVATLIAPRVYQLDPHGPEPGPVHPHWRVRENIMLALEP